MGRGTTIEERVTPGPRSQVIARTVSKLMPKVQTEPEELIFYIPHGGSGANIGLLNPETTIPGVELPSIQLGSPFNRRCFPIQIPSMRAGFCKAVARRAIYSGEIYTVEEWVEVLRRDGVGYKQKGKGKDEVCPLGEATFRALWNQLAYQWMMPLISRAEADGRVGFGLARNRQQVEDNVASRHSRADRMTEKREVLLKVAEAKKGYFAGDRSFSVGSKWDEDRVRLIVRTLQEQTLTNSQIAFTLATGELLRDRGEITLEEEGRHEDAAMVKRLEDAPVRDLLGELRLEGLPICGGNAGCWMAETSQELLDYLGRQETVKDGDKQVQIWTGLQGRINAIHDHAKLSHNAGILVYPQNAAELGARSKVYGNQPRTPIKLSAAANRQHQKALDAEQRRREQEDDEGFQLDQDQTRGWLKKTYGSDAWQAILNLKADRKIGVGNVRPITSDEKDLRRRVKQARKFVDKGVRSKAVYAAPWTKPVDAKPVKVRGPKVASAAAVAGSAAARQETAIEAPPWTT